MRHFWLCLLLLAGPAAAGVPHWSLIDLIQQADAVVHGRVVELREDTAVVAVTGTWKRNLGTERIVVAPITVRHCVGVSPNMKVAEEVVLMLGMPERGCYRVVAGGYGKIAVSAGERTGLLAAVDQLVKIARLEEDGRNRAMLALATAANVTLRRESHLYISGHIRTSKLRVNYSAEMVALLRATEPDARRSALYGLQFIVAPEAIEIMIALTRDHDVNVVRAASVAIAQYDTPATVDALIALTKHENRLVRMRGIVDLQNSRGPKALETFVGLLDDPDPEIRRLACRGFVGSSRREEHRELKARLEQFILADPDQGVRAEAARLAGGTHDPTFVEPLVEALRNATPGGRMEKACLESLNLIQSQGGKEGKRKVEAHIMLYVRSLWRGTGGTAPVDLMYDAKRITDVRWAAQRHPDPEVRRRAARCLGFLMER